VPSVAKTWPPGSHVLDICCAGIFSNTATNILWVNGFDKLGTIPQNFVKRANIHSCYSVLQAKVAAERAAEIAQHLQSMLWHSTPWVGYIFLSVAQRES
jgi:hypothetical protein